MKLREYLKEYRALTLDIIEEVNRSGNIQEIINEREDILSKIKHLNFTQEEICKVCNELKLIELENEMHNVIKREKVNIKRKIANLKQSERGNTQYLNYGATRYVSYNNFDKKM